LKKIAPFILFLLVSCITFSQTDSSRLCHLRISLLTCTPGTELYSTFGHSALRVTDSAANTDIIFNYGTFDFTDPGFYIKFVRGKLLYFVSVDEHQNFLDQYAYEKRGITEQVLNLSCQQKEKLLAALNENAKEENKFYIYDFVYDNCTTRLRDMVFDSAGKMETKNIRPTTKITFRNLIHEYLNRTHQHWSKLGIDILLGAPLDKKLTNSEAMFLPDYLLKAFDSTVTNGKPLVESKSVILNSTLPKPVKPLLTPFVAFSILLLLVVTLSFLPMAEKFLLFFDFLLFFFSGLLGVLLLFMWFGTDHLTTKNNLNLLWAFPFNMIAAFFIAKKRKWVSRYFFGYGILLVLLLILWWPGPQQMNNSLLPVVALLLWRSVIYCRRLY